ncbi:MAG TPA: dihydrodipicolinate synthase family protein [Gammaproteobacteria bacterium]|nr:dihydrodipicolinate synthase family protein [Gammaproteobacteria bacterium]
MSSVFSGILVPALTPFKRDLSPDAGALLAHCRWLLEQGVDGLAVFGTTSEANSLGVDERMSLLEHLVESDIPADKLMPGTGLCALTDTIRLTRHAVELGCGGVLMLPPFYYKAVTDDGLYASYAEVVERVGSARLRIYLYHIPPVAQVGLSLGLIGRLLAAYPQSIAGLKDSSGDWSNTAAILHEYPQLATFCGSEVFLLETLRHGGAGSITATANINPGQIRALYGAWRDAGADELQRSVTAVRRAYEPFATIPALKAVAAEFYGQPEWRAVRPPLRALDDAAREQLRGALAATGFRMGTGA